MPESSLDLIKQLNFLEGQSYQIKCPKIRESVIKVTAPINKQMLIIHRKRSISSRLGISLGGDIFSTKKFLPSECVKVKRVYMRIILILGIAKSDYHLILK